MRHSVRIAERKRRTRRTRRFRSIRLVAPSRHVAPARADTGRRRCVCGRRPPTHLPSVRASGRSCSRARGIRVAPLARNTAVVVIIVYTYLPTYRCYRIRIFLLRRPPRFCVKKYLHYPHSLRTLRNSVCNEEANLSRLLTCIQIIITVRKFYFLDINLFENY